MKSAAWLQETAREVVTDCQTGKIETECIWVRYKNECKDINGKLTVSREQVVGIGPFEAKYKPPHTIAVSKPSRFDFVLPATTNELGITASCVSASEFGVAVGGRDGSILFPQNHKIETAHLVSTTALCWHPSAPVLYSAGFDRAIKVWSAEGVCNSEYSQASKVECLVADTSQLFVGSESGISSYSLDNQQRGAFASTNSVRSLAVTANCLFAAGECGAMMYDLRTDTHTQLTETRSAAVCCSKNYFALSGQDSTAVYDIRNTKAAIKAIAEPAFQLCFSGNRVWGLESAFSPVWGCSIDERPVAYAVTSLKTQAIAASGGSLYVAGMDLREYNVELD